MRRSIRKRLRTSEPTTAPSLSPRGRPPAQSRWERSRPARVHTLRPANQLGEPFLGGFRSQPGPRRRRARHADPNASRSCCGAALALGGGLLVLILIVLGVKGCLNARKHRALSDYARNVTQIVEETEQTSKAFFGKLDDPGDLSVTEFVAEVNADRSAMDNYASRVDGLDAPGDMGHAQNGARAGLRAARQRDERNRRTDEHRARRRRRREGDRRRSPSQMQKLLASDVLYATVVRPEINGVLADNGIEGDDVPESVFLPDGTKWLDEATVSAALGSVSGATGGETSGRARPRPARHQHQRHRTGRRIDHRRQPAKKRRKSKSKSRTRANRPRTASPSRSPSSGGTTLDQDDQQHRRRRNRRPSTIPLTPAPSGEVTLEVEVAAGARRAGHRATTKPATPSNSNRRAERSMRIAYLGPAGTFTEDALREARGRARLRAAAHADHPRRDPRGRARRGRAGAGPLRELDRGIGAQHPRHARLRGRAR